MRIFKTDGGSLFFRNVWIKSSPPASSKIPRINLLFPMKFILFWCKYANLDVFPRGQPPSKCSQLQKCLKSLWWGGQLFSKMSEIKKCLKYPMEGGGLSVIGNFPQRGQGHCCQIYKINPIIPAIASLSGNMFIILTTTVRAPFVTIYLNLWQLVDDNLFFVWYIDILK